MTARAAMISRVTAWLPKCGKALRSLERYRVEDWQKNSISPLSPCIIIRLERMKLQTSKKNICFESRKRTQKQAQKDMDGMEWHKIEYLILSAMRMRKRHLICTSSHHNVPCEKQLELDKGSEP